MAILALDRLDVQYRIGGRIARAVDAASFSLPEGAILGLVGESGCGKTTAARAIMGVLPGNASIAGGRILYRGRDLVRMTAGERKALRWREIAFVPQSAMSSLDPVYRVGAQLAEVLVERGGLDRRTARRQSGELFEMVGLDSGRLDDYPHQLSGGMRQRVAIAMALALRPRIVIADEPVTALDVIVQRQVLDTFRNLQRAFGLSIILVTHDISVVAFACDRIVVMYAGEVVEEGTTAAVLARPCHPYTMGLYNAFPDLQRSAGMLVPIAGSPPDLTDPPDGCRFAPRCPFMQAPCRAPPVAAAAEPDHLASCWRVSEAAMLRDQARLAGTWTPS